MNCEQCEKLQDDIITYMDGYPQDLIDRLCQVIIDYFFEEQVD